MTGLHETADYDTFTYGVADRSASIEYRETENQRGYLEIDDRGRIWIHIW